MTTTPPPTSPYSDPPRRAFGSISRVTGNSASSTPSSSNSHLPLPLRPEANRARSGSSASVNSFERERDTILAAADKGITWLSAWAPKGEGRTRQFLESSLNGVATVASTVGTGVQGAVSDLGVKFGPDGRLGRPLSFNAGSPTDTTNINPMEGFNRLSISVPPGPQHTGSTPAVVTQATTAAPAQRRPPQPSNLARLGSLDTATALSPASSSPSARPNASHAASTSAIPPIPRSISISGSSGLGPHGSSGLNPKAGSSRMSISQGRSVSGNLAKTPSLSRSGSVNTAAGGLSRSGVMPYKVGFQPAGVRNDKTGAFAEARKRAGVEREKEEGRLGRRWAKLVDLHFNPATQLPTLAPSASNGSLTSSTDPKPPSLPRSASSRRSLLSMDGAFDALKPREVWKGLRSAAAAPGAAEENRKRLEEQGIVKWEDDKEAKRCRICQSTFSLSNRKHHCRLCGRIVCSLPPTNPALLAVQIQLFSPADPSAAAADTAAAYSQAALPPGTRREKCSLLLVADWRTGRGEEVEEGFVGWMNTGGDDDSVRRERRKSRTSSISSASVSIAESSSRKGDDGRVVPLPQQPKEVQIKGLRTCRECWGVVSRKQKMQDRQRVSGFARLYAALRALQVDIEEAMGDFEAQMEILTASSASAEPPPRLLKLHKELLHLFAQYEHLSKRLSSMPAEEGGSQSLVQSAVARSSALFLAKEMAKVQALPRLQKMIAAEKRKSMRIVETTLADQLRPASSIKSDASSIIEDVAMMLQPLLEQEAQLETYVSDAYAQRKYEDGKALSMALEEIRAEIARIAQRAAR